MNFIILSKGSHKMKKIVFKGSGVALVTPFTNENKVNFNVLEELIEMHIEKGTDALIVCGTTGEASTLCDDEQEEIISFAVKCVNSRIPVIAGAGSNNTKNVITKVKRAQNAGADAILSVTPFYNKANETGIVEHYTKIAESVSLPVIIYNVPARTGMNISIKALLELSKIDNIVAVKEASGNMSYACEIAAKVPDLGLYSGNDDITVPMMSIGGLGVISVGANILPEEFHKMCNQMQEGSYSNAARIQKRIQPVLKMLFCEVNPIPVKNAMNRLGFGVGNTRLPLGKIDDALLDELMAEIYKLQIDLQ